MRSSTRCGRGWRRGEKKTTTDNTDNTDKEKQKALLLSYPCHPCYPWLSSSCSHPPLQDLLQRLAPGLEGLVGLRRLRLGAVVAEGGARPIDGQPRRRHVGGEQRRGVRRGQQAAA